mgnify:CR=1 FL=1
MLYCSNCDIKYPADEGQGFCDKCGGPVQPLQEQSITPTTASDIALQRTTNGPSGADELPVRLTDQSNTPSSTPTNVDIGDKVTNVYNSTSGQDYCAYGGERVYQDKSFRCPECGRDPICTDHFDKNLRLCPFCVESRTTACSTCNTRQLSENMLKCPRCLKTVCDDHSNDSHALCIECSEQWADVVAAMESGEVAISMGTVIGTDQIEIKGDSIVTKDGHPVATIKENTWYSSPKQWYRVKGQLLDQEKQAMRRFYPNMALEFSDDENAHWSGDIVTWSGKSYSVRLSYPAAFPYRPPKTYVTDPKIVRSRHIYPDGHLCLFHKDDKAWQINTTGATMISWVSLWLHCYEAWLDTGEWPRPEADELEISPTY